MDRVVYGNPRVSVGAMVGAFVGFSPHNFLCFQRFSIKPFCQEKSRECVLTLHKWRAENSSDDINVTS